VRNIFVINVAVLAATTAITCRMERLERGMSKIYKNWPFHNIVGHPLMQVLMWIGLEKAANAVHDGTLPPK
jgi:hypothetical protein